MYRQNKFKVKTLTEIKSFSLLLYLKTNSCLFWAQLWVDPKASIKFGYLWFLTRAGELQQEVIT